VRPLIFVVAEIPEPASLPTTVILMEDDAPAGLNVNVQPIAFGAPW
jgi:hypothetical protein